MTTLAKLPGFREFGPEDMALRNHVFAAWRDVARRYGFSEYDGPPLEPLALYAEKSGEEIVGQLYAFRDRGDRRVALRPEMTPTLARMLGSRGRAMAKPIRWFSIPQLFRYERSQRGRLREHFQFNVDVVGEAAVAADAEALAVAVDAVRALGLGAADFAARVNDRRLVVAVMKALAVPASAVDGCLDVLDKAARTQPAASRQRLEALGVPSPQAEEFLALAAGDGPRSLDDLKRRFADVPDVLAAAAPLAEHARLLCAMGLRAYVEFDFSVVRGLAYYTGIVFELFDRAGELRAICGGGRYDGLLARLGGDALPAVGFGMGDVVLGELLRDRGLAPDGAPGLDYFVIWLDDGQTSLALEVCRRLREAGRSAVCALRSRSLRKHMAVAARSGAARAIVIGPGEAAAGAVAVRDLETGEQETVPLESLLPGAGPDSPAGGAGVGTSPELPPHGKGNR